MNDTSRNALMPAAVTESDQYPSNALLQYATRIAMPQDNALLFNFRDDTLKGLHQIQAMEPRGWTLGDRYSQNLEDRRGEKWHPELSPAFEWLASRYRDPSSKPLPEYYPARLPEPWNRQGFRKENDINEAEFDRMRRDIGDTYVRNIRY